MDGLSHAEPITTRPVQGGRGARSKLDLIRAGVEVFAESGLEGATTREIARRAGQDIAAIRYHFGGKDGLYRATIAYVGQAILDMVGPLLNEIDVFLAQPRRSQDAAIDLLKRLLAAAVISNQQIVPLTQILAREQTRPTDAFDILYDGVLDRFQRAGAALVAAAVGGDPNSVVSAVRFHALHGQTMAFRLARTTILRRTGWAEIGPDEAALIREVVLEDAEWVLRELRRKMRGSRAAPAAARNRARSAKRKA